MKWNVTVDVEKTFDFEVEADSQEEAESKAYGLTDAQLAKWPLMADVDGTAFVEVEEDE